MTKEQISSFKLRITESNPTELVVLLYEIYFAYIEDGISALEKIKSSNGSRETEEYGKALRMASLVLRHLKDDLDFSYDISNHLYSLYDYAQRCIAKATYSFAREDLEITYKVMKPLYESFQEVAKADNSKPIMQHAQKISAGYTYGRNDVTESLASDTNRGFLA